MTCDGHAGGKEYARRKGRAKADNLQTMTTRKCGFGLAASLSRRTHCHRSPIRSRSLQVPKPQSASGWRTLFDGKSLDAWRGYKNRVCAGRLADRRRRADQGRTRRRLDHQGPVRRLRARARVAHRPRRQQRDLLSRHRGPRLQGRPNDDRIYTTGPEYQLLDDTEAADNKTRLTCAAAAYGLYPSPAGHLKPVGEWNSRTHRRQGTARRALAQRLQDGRVRAVEPRLGSESRSRPNSRRGRSSAAPRPAISGFRAITRARSRSATSGSASFDN